MARYAQVAPAVPVGGDGLFTYAIPERLRGDLAPGVRVYVPFGGRRRMHATCVALSDDSPVPEERVRPILGLVEREALATPDLVALGRFVAHRTGCTWGEALDAMLPRAVRTGSRGRYVEEAVLLADRRAVPGIVDELQSRRAKQARTLRILADQGGVLASRDLMRLARVSRSPIRSLGKAGHLTLRRVRVEHDPLLAHPVARTAPLELTPAQRRVRDRLLEALAARGLGDADAGAGTDGSAAVGSARDRGGPPDTFLLHGVTGSGKTEVYLQTLAPVVAAGRQGIVLVPEISLTPQTVRRFRERFERVAVLHSGLTDAERHDQWRRIRRGEADVVVGARSAVFAPVPWLGLVILDEEHETSFKQASVPRYHARDVARERARLAGGVCLLGTATPSLEAWHLSDEGTIERLVLTERVAGGSMPSVRVVDLTVESRRPGFTFLSDVLRAEMDGALARGEQVILFLNRRGWASVLMCGSCRQSLKCEFCSVSVTLHRRAERVICHYCGAERPPPRTCPACGSALASLGFGTEKVEQEVRRSFLGANVARMDSDTMSGRGAHERVLARFSDGRVDVLIGTQMIAKGLDFPNATLVGVLCADSALFLPDYRASERTFQLLSQVIGRTGRGPKGGRVVVQAYDPRHVAIQRGVRQDYEPFAAEELRQREALGYPPFTRLVRVVVHGASQAAAADKAREVRDALAALRDAAVVGAAGAGRGTAGAAPREASVVAEAGDGDAQDRSGSREVRDDAAGAPPGRSRAAGASGGVARPPESEAGARGPAPLARGLVVLGPAPAPIAVINREHRVHVLCKCPDDAGVERVVAALGEVPRAGRTTRLLVDVDPVAML